MFVKLIFFLFSLLYSTNIFAIEKCKWNNELGIPCTVISKTFNSSSINQAGVNKLVITKQEIIESGALDINEVLKIVPGLDIFQSGQKGQQTSIFTRGSESNHTLVLLNGIAINDQSVTDGLHDFGQDFIQTIQQVEVYKGSNGAHFGPNAIGGAINFITDIDYQNSYSISGFNFNNHSMDTNFTKITDNEWHINFKGSNTNSLTNSSIAGGHEADGAKNQQVNFNVAKWVSDNLKFKSTLYSRKTKADYDGSATDEDGYISDNRMYSIQTGLDYKTENKDSNFIIHYHNYDREYQNAGYLDEYYSESFVLRGENAISLSNDFSYGYGTEYKYDWGYFENRGSYSASTKGHMKDFAVFLNAGYKISDNKILSIFTRSDKHNTAGQNETYKINFSQNFYNFKLGATHSTGLRNPSLYELYGSDNYGIKGNVNLKAEKSKTNEIFGEYKFNENYTFSSTAYRTTIFDRIESNAAYSQHENQILEINQEGLENNFSYYDLNQTISIIANFSKSRKTNGHAQSRRPDLSYGANYSKKLSSGIFGPLNLSINYKYTGKFIDWDGSKNARQKSTDLVDMSINKKYLNNVISLSVTNLLDEEYEKPATYAQDGRQFRINFRKLY